MGAPFKIALIGPESSGKTTMCRRLADFFKTTWVPEYSRDYILRLGRPYTLEDIEHSVKEQLKEQAVRLRQASEFLFCDTELIVARVWCADVFKSVPLWIDEEILKHPYDLFLLTSPDLPFENDPVRENPHRRQFFFDWYRSELERYKFPYEVLSGIGEMRTSRAIQMIRKHFPEKQGAGVT